jgi:hypothetical protein
MKKTILSVIIVVVAIFVGVIVYAGASFNNNKEPIVDDTIVDETDTTGGGGGIVAFTSGVNGMVLLGPICPVMQYPPDSQCADRGYETDVQITNVASGKLFSLVHTDASGLYEVSLPPGEYKLEAMGKQPFPICASKTVIIGAEQMQTINLSCDTGIR